MFILHQYSQEKARAWVNDDFHLPLIHSGREFRLPRDWREGFAAYPSVLGPSVLCHSAGH